MRRRIFCQSGAAALAASALGCAGTRPTGASPDVLSAVSSAGEPVALKRADLQAFRAAMTGPVLLRDDAGYHEARQVWNASIDRKPALIARCKTSKDVIESVRFAKERGLLLAVRCGGHSSAGKSVCDDGLMLDLSLMRGVVVDPKKRTAKVDGGALLGDLDAASQAHRLATTAGTVSHTGVGGLTLGGGMGHLGRKFGLTIDNLRAADVVLADGRLVRANASENADLFWALRGGGGNFGVVTSFEFQLHEFGPDIVTGGLVYPLAVAPKVLAFMDGYRREMPDEVTITPVFIALPDGTRLLTLGAHHTGAVADLERVLDSLRKVAPVARDLGAKTVRYVDHQKQSDTAAARRVHGYLKSGFVNALDETFVAAVIEAMNDPSTPPLMPIVMPQAGGAIARISPTATAFPHRGAAYAVLFDLQWSDPAQGDRIVAWARATWKRIEPSMRGVYVNFTSSEDAQSRIREAYGANYPRLVEIKRKYDPDNLFRLNTNIDPAA